jgi:hypothetical protein
MIQFLNQKVAISLKRYFTWYVIIALAGTVVFQEKQKQGLLAENNSLHKINAKKDSIIIAKTQDELRVYQDFMMGMNRVLFLQKLSLEKLDTTISKVVNSQ